MVGLGRLLAFALAHVRTGVMFLQSDDVQDIWTGTATGRSQRFSVFTGRRSLRSLARLHPSPICHGSLVLRDPCSSSPLLHLWARTLLLPSIDGRTRPSDGMGALAVEGSGIVWRATRRRRRGLPGRLGGVIWFLSFFSLISSLIYSCMDGEGIDFRWFLVLLCRSVEETTNLLIDFISCYSLRVSLSRVWIWSMSWFWLVLMGSWYFWISYTSIYSSAFFFFFEKLHYRFGAPEEIWLISE